MEVNASNPTAPSAKATGSIADIFAQHHQAYQTAFAPPAAHNRVIRAISACRTKALGGRLLHCLDCQQSLPLYNSCRNRHCPTCQNAQQARWLAQRQRTILPTPYFHVVFTLPQLLREIVRQNPQRLLTRLMRCAADTLQTLAQDPKRLGATLGITAVLHTWTRTLQYHPHVHCIVTGGGITADNAAWRPAREGFLFAANVVRRLFRGRFMAALRVLYGQGDLHFHGSIAQLSEPDAFRRLKERLYDQNWVVYAKQPFAGPEQVFAYLGRYTHRVGLTPARLTEVTADRVTFTTKQKRTTTVTPLEFMRRFMQHVLPKRFVKIRHYGLYAAKHVHEAVPLARSLLQTHAAPRDVRDASAAAAQHTENQDAIIHGPWEARLFALTGIGVRICQSCGSGRLEHRPLVRRDTS